MANAATTSPTATGRLDRIDRILGQVGALDLGLLPRLVGQRLGLKPLLQFARRIDQRALVRSTSIRAAAILGSVGHLSVFSFAMASAKST